MEIWMILVHAATAIGVSIAVVGFVSLVKRVCRNYLFGKSISME